ncbi:HHK17, histidine kinase-group VII protein [Calycina marina]|uniref:histidine kinase n=1 Tax=Calycina marina TaxID=1763456 RepID=A0A9P7YWX0_9HELO|nr:HHK17, histidine kinase-group VII protein [Calycina marina]
MFSNHRNPCCEGMQEAEFDAGAFMVRSRAYRPTRKQRPLRNLKEHKHHLSSQALHLLRNPMEADNMIMPDIVKPESIIERASLCLPDYEGDSILHCGDAGFSNALQKYFLSSESNAAERLVLLKSRIRTASTYDFWGILVEEMCDITGAQCSFVVERTFVDDRESAVDMPEYGEPGSCLMGVAIYVNNGKGVQELHRDYRYHAYGTPCEHMRHNKVFIIPERLSEYTPNNSNKMPWRKSEAFIGIPLFADGKCFAHFGLIWDSDGAPKRCLSWSFIEMFLHALEDMILERILEDRRFAKPSAPPESYTAKKIPLSAITASQSLKPYARSLSHELRTPMQGVVGMLDIMYATVLEAISNQPSENARELFVNLKDQIEVVQDSSKRAVEAADNVVHAYDLNMQMPETPLTPVGSDTDMTAVQQAHMDFANSLVSPVSRKHEREEDSSFHPGPPLKKFFTNTEAQMFEKYNTGLQLIPTDIKFHAPTSEVEYEDVILGKDDALPSPSTSPVKKRIVIRDFFKLLTADALRSGHPIAEVHTETELGEKIEVKTVNDRGHEQSLIIHLNIDDEVPEAVVADEKYLHFAVQKVVDNAIKFTEAGSIIVSAKMSKGVNIMEIRVLDTGCGISEESQFSIFKPHFQEDASRHRTRDGLGLSLFNAKAHVRRHLEGDVTLERSATRGLLKGSEFLIRLPFHPGSSRTPLAGTPSPTFQLTHAGVSLKPSAFHLSSLSTPMREPSPPRKTNPKLFNGQLATACPLNILVAEDNQINRNVAVGCLDKLGYEKSSIALAFDGVEAVERYAASMADSQHPGYDAILMDIWMPNMDGYEAATSILELARKNGKIPKIIAVTADITGESIERAKEVGMRGFLAKPYKVLDMENMIVEHFCAAEDTEKRRQRSKRRYYTYRGAETVG